MISKELKQKLSNVILNDEDFGNNVRRGKCLGEDYKVTHKAEIISMLDYKDDCIIILTRLDSYFASDSTRFEDEYEYSCINTFLYDVKEDKLYYKDINSDNTDGLYINGIESNYIKLNLD